MLLSTVILSPTVVLRHGERVLIRGSHLVLQLRLLVVVDSEYRQACRKKSSQRSGSKSSTKQEPLRTPPPRDLELPTAEGICST